MKPSFGLRNFRFSYPSFKSNNTCLVYLETFYNMMEFINFKVLYNLYFDSDLVRRIHLMIISG